MLINTNADTLIWLESSVVVQLRFGSTSYSHVPPIALEATFVLGLRTQWPLRVIAS